MLNAPWLCPCPAAAVLDTADPESRAAFLKSHAELVEGVVALSKKVQVRVQRGLVRNPLVGWSGAPTRLMQHCHQMLAASPCTHVARFLPRLCPPAQADKELTNLIRRKFAIKCTTGYSLNALVRRNFLRNLLAAGLGFQTCAVAGQEEVPAGERNPSHRCRRCSSRLGNGCQEYPPPPCPLHSSPQVDFHTDDPIEIIKRLMIGSEGTLGFVSQVGRGRLQKGRGREVSCTALARDALSSVLVVFVDHHAHGCLSCLANHAHCTHHTGHLQHGARVAAQGLRLCGVP